MSGIFSQVREWKV